MTKIRLALAVSALALSAGIASAQTAKVPSYDEASACLKKVCLTHSGQTACLTENRHFRNGFANPGPNDIGTNVELAGGLKTHPVWQAAVKEIEACMSALTLAKKAEK